MYSDTVLITIDKIISGSFEGRSSLKTYIFQIFHNKSVDLIRKKSTNKYSVYKTISISDMLVQLSDNVKPVIEKLIEKCDWETLKTRLSELGENCRQLLMLSAGGYTDKEIAIAMEYKTADVVKTSRLRCLEKLRNLYKNRPN
jgi:RNA polymerase sigma-70 factor (ECF subfamily)